MHQASLSLSLSTATHVRQAQASWADILVWHSRLLEELQDAEFVQGATGQRYQVGFAERCPVSCPCLLENSKCTWIYPLAQGLPDRAVG